MSAVVIGLATAWMLISAGSALALRDINRQFVTTPSTGIVTVYTAKKILTMEPGNPDATAVAVDGKHILAAGSLDEVKAALLPPPILHRRGGGRKVSLLQENPRGAR